MKIKKDFAELEEGMNLTPDNIKPQILKCWDLENAFVKTGNHVYTYTWSEIKELYF